MKDQETDVLRSGSGDGGIETTLEDCGELSEAAMGELEILVGSRRRKEQPSHNAGNSTKGRSWKRGKVGAGAASLVIIRMRGEEGARDKRSSRRERETEMPEKGPIETIFEPIEQTKSGNEDYQIRWRLRRVLSDNPSQQQPKISPNGNCPQSSSRRQCSSAHVMNMVAFGCGRSSQRNGD